MMTCKFTLCGLGKSRSALLAAPYKSFSSSIAEELQLATLQGQAIC